MFTDQETVEALFRDGVIDGRVRLFASDARAQVIGLYRGGLPHGPVWILPYSMDEEGAVLVRLHQHLLCKGKYNCMADLLFDWLGFSCFVELKP